MTDSYIPKRFIAKWALAAIVLLVAAWYAVYSAPLPFVQSWWNAAGYKPDDSLHKRARIADQLVSSKALIGKSRQQIVQMLGEPPPSEYFHDWNMVYKLGDERGSFSIDSEWLVIRFGSSGNATEAAVLRD